MNRFQSLADEIYEAQATGCFAPGACGPMEWLTEDEAYQVQAKLVARRLGDGRRLAGYKVGCTSPAIRAQFGLAEPIHARLLEPHVYSSPVELPHASFIHCSVEPEFVFALRCDVTEDFLRRHDPGEAVAYVAPGIEVHHYRFFHGKPTSQELIASNGLHAALIVGNERAEIASHDWQSEQVRLVVNGKVAASGVGAEIQGGPLRSLSWLAQALLRRGECLRAGDLVIPGSPTALIPVPPDSCVEADFDHLGSATALFR